MTQEELNEKIKLHELWLEDKGGKEANLEGANLWNANLWNANLEEANLKGANLEGAYLKGANLDYRIQDGLLKQIAEIVLKNPDSLDMESWHCKTTHCLAGWACEINPVAKELEETHGTQIAGLLTLGAEPHSYFFKLNKEVIEYLKTIKKD